MATELLTKKQLVLIQKQVAWGTPKAITDSGYVAFTNLTAGSQIPDPDPVVDVGNFISQRGNTDEIGQVYVDQKSGLPSIPFAGTASIESLAYMFDSIFQEYVEDSGVNYQKAFTPLSETQVIDFTVDATLYTVLVVNFNGTGISDIIRLQNAVISDFEFSVEPNNRGFARNAKITGKFIGTELDYDVNSAVLASYTKLEFTRFNDTSKFTLNIDTNSVSNEDMNDMCYKKFSFKYRGNFDVDCRGAGGVITNFRCKQQFFFDVTLPYMESANMATIQKNYAEGKNVVISFATGTNGIVGYLSFTNWFGIQVQNPLGADGDYWQRPLSIQLFSSSTSTNRPPVEVYLTDGKEL